MNQEFFPPMDVIESKNHNHIMVFAGTIKKMCENIHIYQCADNECGYWNSSSEYNKEGCDMQVTRFGTKITCYECTKCGRKLSERS